MKIRILICLTSLIIFSGCSKQQNQAAEVQPEEKIDGSVFIVTEGAENIKLGLVTVALFDEKQITPAILKAATALAQTNLDTFNGNEGKIDQDELKYQTDKTKEAQVFLDKEKQPGISEEDFLSFSKQANAIMDERDDKTRYEQRQSERKARIYNWVWDTFKIYVNNIGVPIDTAKTDADGKFSFAIHKGSYLLAAIAERKVSDDTEYYLWLVQVDFDGKPSKQAMLSNDNLIITKNINDVVPYTESASIKFVLADITVELSNPYYYNRDQIIVLKGKGGTSTPISASSQVQKTNDATTFQ